MKMKKVLAAALAAAMTMSMAACGSASGSSAATSADGASASGAAFKLGGSGPLTGDAAVYGTAVKNAIELAVSEINAEGKVQFEVNFQDDQATGEAATSAYNTLIDWGMQISTATVTSGAGQAVSELYANDNIFAISPSGSSTAVIFRDAENAADPYGNIFQMCFTDPNQGSASALYLSEHPDLGSKIAIIYRNDDNYSTGIRNNFVDKAKEIGLNVVYEGTFTNGASDFSVQIKQANEAGADICFLPIYYQPASLVLAEAAKQGYTPTFFGCDGMDGILAQEGFDTALAEGLYMLTPYSADATDEATQHFTNAYKEKYGDTPNQFAADAYDAVNAIAQAIEAEGLTPDASQDDITAGLIKQFTSMTFDGITGTSVSWNENGEVTKDPKAIVIKDGAYVSAE